MMVKPLPGECADVGLQPTAMVEGNEADRRAFRKLYEDHSRYVHNLLRQILGPKVDADDLLHDAFLVAWKAASARRGAFPDRAYLGGIAIRIALAFRRRRRLWDRLTLQPRSRALELRTPEAALDSAERLDLVYRLLDELSEKKRIVFILYEIQELSGEEVARVLACPVETVKTRLHYARAEFLEALRRWQAAEDARSGEVRK